MDQTRMRVKKRDGTLVPVRLDEITDRIASLMKDLDQKIIDPVKITLEVVEKIHDGISTSLIDSFTAEICHSKAIEHPHFNILASRLIIGDHQKTIKIIADLKFSEVCKLLYTNTDQLGEPSPLISDEMYTMSQENKEMIDNMVDNKRDFLLDYFGFKTLSKNYLLKVAGKIVETPQHMFMRVALGIHGKFKLPPTSLTVKLNKIVQELTEMGVPKDQLKVISIKLLEIVTGKSSEFKLDEGKIYEADYELVKETYDLLSMKYFTHATPTLYNAGTRWPQFFSCFEENTLVDTLNGPKPIKDVNIGDKVITHKGNIKSVQQIHKNLVEDREVYELKIKKTIPLKVTGNHKLWTYNNGKTDWKSVADLSDGDYIGIPKYSGTIENDEIDVEKEIKEIFDKNGEGFDNRESVMEELVYDEYKVNLKTSWFNTGLNNGQPLLVTRQNNSINKIIKIDENFCRFLGIWYGDGHICTRKDIDGNIIPVGIGITTSKDNTEMINFCIEIKEYFGIEPSFRELKGQNTYQILYNSKILGAIFEHMYGKGFEGKRLNQDIFKYSTKLVISFMEGIISSDGCISKSGAISLCMANKHLIDQIYTLCRLHNFEISGPSKTTGGKLTKHQAYQLNLTCMRYDLENIYKTYTDDRLENLKLKTNIRNQFSVVEIDGFKFLPYETKIKINLESEYVYTLGVEDDHSYSIGGIIAENCFLKGMGDSLTSQNNDSTGSIYTTLEKVAEVSKRSGGIGIHVHDIRANGSYIRGTGGKGDGLVPMLKVYNDTARYVNQGGRRSGSFAIYLEPWHADIQDFLKLGLKHGDQNRRATDLFYALWIPDLFMERVKANEPWSLMCPSECPGLANVYGKDFKKLYEKYEKEGRVVKTINSQNLWNDIIKSQIETGTPYMTYKDAANYKSNQKNVGTIKSSNLCSEVMEYSDTEKYACCVLSSMVLPTYVVPIPVTKSKKKEKNSKFLVKEEEYEHESGLMFDHAKLAEVVKIVTRNLNKLIDINYYPVEETRRSNMSERPIGIGIQGLADVFFKMGLAYDSEEAIKLDREIMETIYFATLTASMELSKIHGPYATFKGSPLSKGQFQFDLWKEFPTSKEHPIEIIHSGRYDWDGLRKGIKKDGVYNSLNVALMPTATTSQIMGSVCESFEPITSNCYARRVKAGEYLITNPYMAADLIKAGLWNEDMRQKLLTSRGSIQSFDEIPLKLKNVYKTVWEIQQKVLIDHSVARAPYIDQSQSLNLYFADGNPDKITKAHFYGWSKGLKTGSYYIRTKSAINAASFTKEESSEETQQTDLSKKLPDVDISNEEACTSCGS